MGTFASNSFNHFAHRDNWEFDIRLDALLPNVRAKAFSLKAQETAAREAMSKILSDPLQSVRSKEAEALTKTIDLCATEHEKCLAWYALMSQALLQNGEATVKLTFSDACYFDMDKPLPNV